MENEYTIVFNKDIKLYPSQWWTLPEKHGVEVEHTSSFKDKSLVYYGKFFLIYLILWAVIYYLYPERSSFNDVLPGFILGLLCFVLWFSYYIDSTMIFFSSETKDYYKTNIPHGRRIILNTNKDFDIGENAAIMKHSDYKKLQKELKISDMDYPSYSNDKMEKLVSSGKTNAGIHERSSSLRDAGFNIAFTVFSFGFLLSLYKDKTLLTDSYYWLCMAVLFSFFPSTIIWFGFHKSRYPTEAIFIWAQFLQFLAASFGFTAAYIAYKKTWK